MKLLHPQIADTRALLPIPLEPLFRPNRKRRTPLQHALWFTLGVVAGWLTHALLAV